MTTHAMDLSKRRELMIRIASRFRAEFDYLPPWDQMPIDQKMELVNAVENALAGYIVFKGAPGLERRHRGARRST